MLNWSLGRWYSEVARGMLRRRHIRLRRSLGPISRPLMLARPGALLSWSVSGTVAGARMAMVSMARLMFCPSWLGWATFYE
jgi:hypothetical protein